MADNQKKILEMLADKKITVDEAQRLLNLIDSQGAAEDEAPDNTSKSRQPSKYLRIVVQPDSESDSSSDVERVNIRVPMNLVRAGMKLTSLIPPHVTSKVNEAIKEKGIDFDLRTLKPDDIEELVDALSDLEVDVQNRKEKVRIYVE